MTAIISQTKKIKQLIEEAQYQEALALLGQELRSNASSRGDYNSLLNQGKLLQKIPFAIFKERGLLTKKIAILGGYMTAYLAPILRTQLYSRGIAVELFEGAYGTYESMIRGHDEELKQFMPDIVYLCVGTPHVNFSDPHLESVANEAARWKTLCHELHRLLRCEVILNTFVEPLERVFGHYETRTHSETSFIQKLNAHLAAESESYVHFCDMNHVAAYHGKAKWLDAKLYDMAKAPVSYDYLADYSEQVARVASSIWGKAKKCLILDLDNTLWGGIIGEDDLSGIAIGEDSGPGEAFKRFQSYVKKLKDRGVILAVCSKNEPENARKPFEKRTDMVLKMEDFSAFYANWNPKHQNIIAIAEELNIGLDSLVFVDDSPVEREIVRQNLPMVSLVDLPTEPAEYVATLDRAGYFETVSVTAEDASRTSQYVANRRRNAFSAQIQDYGEFLESLEMRAVLDSFDEINRPRITQLINKTNQFNLTTPSYSEAEVESLTAGNGYITSYVKLKDKFGDNGLISVLIAKMVSSGVAEIDTWLMSCRVLKRGVETFLFQDLIRVLKTQNYKRLKGRYVPTAKNKMVQNLLGDMGMTSTQTLDDGCIDYELDLTDEKNIKAILSKKTHIRKVAPQEY